MGWGGATCAGDMWTEGVLPTDYPLEGMRQWKLHYAVFEDGGRTRVVAEQIICAGQEFDAVHPRTGRADDRRISRRTLDDGDARQQRRRQRIALP